MNRLESWYSNVPWYPSDGEIRCSPKSVADRSICRLGWPPGSCFWPATPCRFWEPSRPRLGRPEPIKPEALQVLPADDRGMAMIVGRRGSVPPDRWVVVHTLDTDEFVITQADGGGRFSVSAFAPAGAVLQIHHRVRRPPLPELDPDPSSSPALILELTPSTSSRDRDDRLNADAIMRQELARVVVRCRLSERRGRSR